MTGYDLAEWEAFERTFGPIVIHERIDAAQAMSSLTIARSHGAKLDGPPERWVEKFLPMWDQPPRHEQSPDELVEVLRTWARRGKDKPSPH